MSAGFAELRRHVVSDPELQARLRAVTDWPAFAELVVAVSAERGCPVSTEDLEEERRAARRAWLERWI